MDKYNSKTSFQKWISSINLNNLSEEGKRCIKNFDYYSKKLDFKTILKVLLHAVYEELPSYREIDLTFLDPRLCIEIGINSLCHSSLSRKSGDEIIQLYVRCWAIEVNFKMCKQYLKLTKYQRLSYDGIFVRTTAVAIAYMILAVQERSASYFTY